MGSGCTSGVCNQGKGGAVTTLFDVQLLVEIERRNISCSTASVINHTRHLREDSLYPSSTAWRHSTPIDCLN
jgi:hypothetical protein